MSTTPDDRNAEPPLARVVGVRRTYGEVIALDDVCLDLPRGELVGLLVPNGAGKSTLIGLLCGQRKPSSGRVEIFGGDPRSAANRVRLGMTPQETGLPPTLKAAEVLSFVAAHYPDPIPPARCSSGSVFPARRTTRPARCPEVSSADSRSRSPSWAARN